MLQARPGMISAGRDSGLLLQCPEDHTQGPLTIGLGLTCSPMPVHWSGAPQLSPASPSVWRLSPAHPLIWELSPARSSV